MELQTCEETIKINRRIYMSQVQEIYWKEEQVVHMAVCRVGQLTLS
jgi:hypothetical protein